MKPSRKELRYAELAIRCLANPDFPKGEKLTAEQMKGWYTCVRKFTIYLQKLQLRKNAKNRSTVKQMEKHLKKNEHKWFIFEGQLY